MNGKYHLFNQMAGPLFRELACAIAERAPSGATLYTGHPDTLAYAPKLESLEIVRMPGYDRRSTVSRIASWLRFTGVALVRFARMARSDTAVIVSNPPTMAPVAWLGRLFGRRYFVLVYDMHPDAMVSMGALPERGLVARMWRYMNRHVWNASEGVVTIGHRMAERLSNQFSPEETLLGKVEVVPIWVDTDVVKPIARSENRFAEELGIGERTVVLYSGNMGFSHDIDSILGAAKILSSRDDIVFVLIGEGARWQDAHDFMKRHELSNLMVLPFQPEETLPLSLGMADVALVSLDVGAEGLMIPSKTFYYMSAGAAVIAICQGDSELRDTILESGCGVQVAPGKPDLLADEIGALADDRTRLGAMKSASRAYCVSNHSRAACTAHFIEILDRQGVTQDA